MKKFLDKYNPFKKINPLVFASATLFGAFAVGAYIYKQRQQNYLKYGQQIPKNWFNKTDSTSISNLDDVNIKHTTLKYEIDFQQKVLRGYVNHFFSVLKDGLNTVILDCKNISIRTCTLDNQDLQYKLCCSEKYSNILGDYLIIQLPKKFKKNDEFNIDIEFETIYSEKETSAINWLNPEQTLGKKYQYMFTQCQAIYCRTLFPCQDSPAIKATYKSEVVVADPYKVYTSGTLIKSEANQEKKVNTYFFEQNVPIPSYLYAIVSGNLQEISISQRTSVICEPENAQRCQKELEDTEAYLKTLEQYLTNYQFQDYKIVILPPSFPYGGMENPQLTFASPTIIVGDKSQTDVVIHEITHSWSGNLVTCSNWDHFWLNEGLTTYIESKIIKQLHGEEECNVFLTIGNSDLRTDINQYGPDNTYTALIPQLGHNNPDDAFSRVPYHKGCQLFYELERLFGGEKEFQTFLKSYFTFFERKSIDTDIFFSYLNKYLSNVKDPEFVKGFWSQFDIDKWTKLPGMPLVDITQRFKSTKIDQVKELANTLLKNENEFYEKHTDTFQQLSVSLKVIFFQSILDQINTVSLEQIKKFDQKFSFSQTCKNPEINVKWLVIAIKVKHTEAYKLLEEILSTVGRMKYLKPLYKALFETDPEYSKRLFQQNEKSYHSIAQSVIKSYFK